MLRFDQTASDTVTVTHPRERTVELLGDPQLGFVLCAQDGTRQFVAVGPLTHQPAQLVDTLLDRTGERTRIAAHALLDRLDPPGRAVDPLGQLVQLAVQRLQALRRVDGRPTRSSSRPCTRPRSSL